MPPTAPEQLDDPLSDDAITGDFRVFQRVRGHRFSVDDVLTAWEASQLVPEARRYVDLGSGIGSVATMVTWRRPALTGFAVEALEVSFGLLTRNLTRNGLDARLTAIHGDLRDPVVLDRCGRGAFDLVTGTPPYFPVGTAIRSPDDQRAHARIELRGGVEAYANAIAALLADEGLGVFCVDARIDARVHAAVEGAALRVVARRDVIPRAEAKGPLFALWTVAHRSSSWPSRGALAPYVLRDRDGARTEAAHALRRYFGLDPSANEPPSP